MKYAFKIMYLNFSSKPNKLLLAVEHFCTLPLWLLEKLCNKII